MEVAADSPPARKQEERGLFLAVSSDVLSRQTLGWLAPDFALALAAAKELLLPVGLVVDVDARQAEDEQEGRERQTHVIRVVHQVIRVARIQRWHPDQTSPANVEARTVVLNVHGAHVTHFPPEELENIDDLQRSAHKHRVADGALLLVLGSRVREARKAPIHHAKAAIGEQLDVPANVPQRVAEARVQLSAPEDVKDQVARVARVTRRRRKSALQVENHAQHQRRQIQESEHARRVLVLPACIEKFQVQATDRPERHREQEARHAVGLVLRDVSRGRRGPEVQLARHQPHHQQLNQAKRKHVKGSIVHLGPRWEHGLESREVHPLLLHKGGQLEPVTIDTSVAQREREDVNKEGRHRHEED